jgi:trehalose 6-phosphate synthase
MENDNDSAVNGELGGNGSGEDGRVRRLVVVSNRLPIVLKHDPGGGWKAEPGQGGLVTALAPVLRDRGGLWVGWPGTVEDAADEAVRDAAKQGGVGYDLECVTLTGEELENYYHGFSNEILWPLFHDLPDRCNFEPAYWPVYRQVNHKFAETIARTTREEDYVWIQDYHLLLAAEQLRLSGVERRLGFFLHIPFPPPDTFMKLPWRFQVLEAMLEYDLLGFQTARDLRNFIQCVRALIAGARVQANRRMAASITTRQGRELRLGAFPIGIDYKKFSDLAQSQHVAEQAWYIHEALPERKLIFGVDRLDYTKGIPQRILALSDLLERYPEHRGQLTFIQVVVPSRTEVPEYQQLRRRVEQLVGQVNGRFTTSGWTPIHYIARPLALRELIAYYRTAEIGLITPLKDGMNLVAKEYCACSLDEGVLILSEFAGAAAQLHSGALLANPFDIQGLADRIHAALTMEQDERLARMRRLRRCIARQNVFWWVDSFLRAAIAQDLGSFPQVEYFVPRPPEPSDAEASLTSSGL